MALVHVLDALSRPVGTFLKAFLEFTIPEDCEHLDLGKWLTEE
jgi:hypothetical protein